MRKVTPPDGRKQRVDLLGSEPVPRDHLYDVSPLVDVDMSRDYGVQREIDRPTTKRCDLAFVDALELGLQPSNSRGADAKSTRYVCCFLACLTRARYQQCTVDRAHAK